LTLPSFLIAGAPRCGTTSLHYYLRQHAQICMSAIKEPNFFLFGANGEPLIDEQPIIRKSVRKLADYTALFRPTDDTRAIGEASPLYLYTRPAAERIAAVCGVVRIICVLRRPAERAWSHFLHAFADVPEEVRTARFTELVDLEMQGGPQYEPYRTPTHLVRLGRYAEQLRHYHDTFGEENVLVLLYDDLAERPEAALRNVCEFIEVDPSFEFTLEHRYNTSGAPAVSRIPVLRRALRRAQPRIKAMLPPRLAGRLAEVRVLRSDGGLAPAPPLEDGVANRIADWCKNDVRELGQLLGRDLDDWTQRPVL
jgi:hypothetical protein